MKTTKGKKSKAKAAPKPEKFTLTLRETGPVEFDSLDAAARVLDVPASVLRTHKRTGDPIPKLYREKVRSRLLEIAADDKARERDIELAKRRDADPAEAAFSRAQLIANAIAQRAADIDDDIELDPDDTYRAINEGKTVISAGIDAIRRLRYVVEFAGYPDEGIDDLVTDIEIVATSLEQAEIWDEKGEIGNRPMTEIRAAVRRARTAGAMAAAQAARVCADFRTERSRRDALEHEAREQLDAVIDKSDFANDEWADVTRLAERWGKRDDD